MVPTSPFGDSVFTEKCSGFDSPCLCCARIQKAAVSVASGKFMQSFSAFFVLLVPGIGCTWSALAQTPVGAQQPESEPIACSRDWSPRLIRTSLRTRYCFARLGNGPFRLALIAHASMQNLLRRAQMLQSEYRVLAAWLVARAFAVLVPQRPGHGATSRRYLEDQAAARRLIIPRRARHPRGADLSARAILCPAGRVR